jgi:hypothetical protein
MMRPASLVEEQVGLAVGMHYGGRGHGASAPRSHGGVLSSDSESVISSLCGYGGRGAECIRSSGIRLPATEDMRFSEQNSSQCVAARPVGEKSRQVARRGLRGAFAPQRHPTWLKRPIEMLANDPAMLGLLLNSPIVDRPTVVLCVFRWLGYPTATSPSTSSQNVIR